MVEVTLWGALGQLAGGQSKVEVEAKDIRELFRKLAEQYPGIEPWIEKGIAVAIDGTIYRDTWSKELPKGAEIFLLPRLAGGEWGGDFDIHKLTIRRYALNLTSESLITVLTVFGGRYFESLVQIWAAFD
ncbi:MoaD/ThiS family protein [Mesorhizobium sp. C120A]|nr:MoaD/ThiS family protein [Mesorhizobium sp. C120A]WJI46215.1 MoaD/ThiS family protein [Mesorhizobium sp. C120A]